jgi:N-methylhydantoinase B/oxoprolinase/acetone carboxylase alpha subunit
MNRLEIIVSAVLFLSILFNIGVFLYARAAVTRLLFVSEELGDLQTMVNAFAKHVKSVYELEMFYGDATLEHLLNHAVSFNEQLETFEHIYSLTEEEEEEISKEEETHDDTGTEETTPQIQES